MLACCSIGDPEKAFEIAYFMPMNMATIGLESDRNSSSYASCEPSIHSFTGAQVLLVHASTEELDRLG
jgi:hypothetical protein